MSKFEIKITVEYEEQPTDAAAYDDVVAILEQNVFRAAGDGLLTHGLSRVGQYEVKARSLDTGSGKDSE